MSLITKIYSHQVLTQNGENNNNKIKEIPRLFKVIMTKRKHFETALSCKDDDEKHVEVIQNVRQNLGRLVMVQRHG